jgi:cytochrome c-type biogenesis protein CcmH
MPDHYKRSLACLLACFLASTLWLGDASAKDAPLVAADPALEAKMLRIAAELRCLVCQNQTLADSDASLAIDLREQMRVMLRSGSDEAQVRDFMTERYGDFVLYRPPVKATTFLLWFGPALLLVGGFIGLGLVLRRRSRLGEEHFEPDELDAAEQFESLSLAAEAMSQPHAARARGASARGRRRSKDMRKSKHNSARKIP